MTRYLAHDLVRRRVKELIPDVVLISVPRYNKWEWFADEMR